MSSNVIEHKCPLCGGALRFDANTQKMLCDFCDSQFNPNEIKSENLNKADKEFTNEEIKNLNVYICVSCGGEIIVDETLAATKCPFCDNNVVLKEKYSGGLKPDLLIPFKFDKNAVKEKYASFIKGKYFLPKDFKDKNHIDEVKSVYIPFWLVDQDTNGECSYEATKVRRWEDRRYRYEETSYYKCDRTGDFQFRKVPADASSKLPDDLSQSIEPYNINEAVNFQTQYLSGFYAEKWDVSKEEVLPIIEKRNEKSIQDELAKTVKNYDSVNVKTTKTNTYNAKVWYALFPIWLLNTTYKDKKYQFALNGQTGKMVGDLPKDKAKATLLFILLTIAFSIIAIPLVAYFVGDAIIGGIGGIICAALGAAAVNAIISSQLKTVKNNETSSDYIGSNGFKLLYSNDTFVTKKVRKRPKDDGGHGGPGGHGGGGRPGGHGGPPPRR